MSKITIHKDNELEFSSEKSHANISLREVVYGPSISLKDVTEQVEKMLAALPKPEQITLIQESVMPQIIEKVVEVPSLVKDLELHKKHLELSAQLQNLKAQQELVLARMNHVSKENEKLSHHIELLEHAVKVQPVHIKTERIVASFDYRLVLFNVVLAIANICLVCHILAN